MAANTKRDRPDTAASFTRPARPELKTRMGRPWQGRHLWHPYTAAMVIYGAGGMWAVDSQQLPARLLAADLPGWLPSWLAAAAVAAIIVAVFPLAGLLLVAGERYCSFVHLFGFTAGLYIALWLLSASWHGAYAPDVQFLAIVGWVLFSALYKAARGYQRAYEEHWNSLLNSLNPGQPTADIPGLSDGERWQLTFAEAGLGKIVYDPAGRPQVQGGLTYVRRIPTGAALVTVQMRLPVRGLPFSQLVSSETIQAIERAFTQDLGSVRIERVQADQGHRYSSSEVLIHFDVEDFLAQILMMPDDHSPLSIYDAFPVGRFVDGTPLTLTLAEIHGMIIGMTGAGKSNLLHVLIHQLSRCIDVVLWAIDLKGGVTLKPWLKPWIEGKVNRPIFDRVAVNPYQAYDLMQAAVAITIDRATRIVGSKWRATRRNPALIIIADEISELAGSYALPSYRGQHGAPREMPTASMMGALFVRLFALGRGPGVWGLVAGQSDTADMFGPSAAKKNIKLRVGMGTANPRQYQGLFGDSNVVGMLGKLIHPGSLLVQAGNYGTRAMVAGSYFYGDDDDLLRRVERAVIAHTSDDERGPAPLPARDRRIAERFGHVERWTPEETGWLYASNDDEGPAESAPQEGGEGGAEASAPAPQPTDTEPRVGRSGKFRDLSKFRNPPPPRVDQDVWENIVRELEAVDSESPMPDRAVGDDEAEEANAVERILVIVDEAGPRGIGSGQLAGLLIKEGILSPGSRTAIYRPRLLPLAMHERWGERRVLQPSGRGGRFYSARNWYTSRKAGGAEAA